MFFSIKIITKIISFLYNFVILFFRRLYYIYNNDIDRIIQGRLKNYIYWKVSLKKRRIYKRLNNEYRFDFQCKYEFGSKGWQLDTLFERLYNKVDVLISVAENCLFLNGKKKVWEHRKGYRHYNEYFSDICYNIRYIYIFINGL